MTTRLTKCSLAVVFTASVAGLVWMQPRLSEQGVPAWQDRTGMEAVARQVFQDALAAADAHDRKQEAAPARDRQHIVLYVYAEPELVYHLCFERYRREARTAASGASISRVHAVPVANLGFAHAHSAMPFPTFLVVGPHGLRATEFADQWNPRAALFRHIGTYEDRPSDLVLLNDRPGRPISPAVRQTATVQLWKLESPPAAGRFRLPAAPGEPVLSGAGRPD
jgi:hypothetical protein